MKGLFPEYADLSESAYARIWKEALFVFDTNVLLNLYRYQSSTRDELLKILEQLSGRIWIPHHVALEFQRNRLKVIAEQNRRFSEVRKTIEKARSGLFADLEKLQLQRRHSLINPQPLTSGFKRLVDEFLEELGRLQDTQQKILAPDPLREKIESLFEGRVGSPPKSQEDLDRLYKEADARFKLQIPPGYSDDDKDKNEPDGHMHQGIIYKRKYGDYLVWRQLLAHCKAASAKSIVFVTDDGKEDWWRKIDSDGPKTIGPRPELLDEARGEGALDFFLMYNPEGFLKYAKEFLMAQVSEATLTEVRDVSTVKGPGVEKYARMEAAVLAWLRGRYENVQEQLHLHGGPDFVTQLDGKKIGFELLMVNSSERLRSAVYRTYYQLKENGFDQILLIFVVEGWGQGTRLFKMINRMHVQQKIPDGLEMIIGTLGQSESGQPEFWPMITDIRLA